MSDPFDISKMGNLVKQAKALQDRLAEIQESAGARIVEGTAGGGMVKIRINGKLEILGVSVEPEVFASADRDMLQDLIAAAANQAIRQAQAMMAEEMAKLTGGLSIPGLG